VTAIQGGGNTFARSGSREARPGAEPWPSLAWQAPRWSAERRAPSVFPLRGREFGGGGRASQARLHGLCAYRRSASLDFFGAGRWKGLLGTGVAILGRACVAGMPRHCERGEAIQRCGEVLDCFVAWLLAMTRASSAPALRGRGTTRRVVEGASESELRCRWRRIKERDVRCIGLTACGALRPRPHPPRKRAVPPPHYRGAG
jgi:hypothetical protein